jgi:hypothetical protein
VFTGKTVIGNSYFVYNSVSKIITNGFTDGRGAPKKITRFILSVSPSVNMTDRIKPSVIK